VISAGERHLPSREAVDHLLEGSLITMPTFPVKALACIAIASVSDPTLAALFLRKCDISSMSRTMAFPVGSGLTACSVAQRRIHLRIELVWTPHIWLSASLPARPGFRRSTVPRGLDMQLRML
jgi:hypothetical protein